MSHDDLMLALALADRAGRIDAGPVRGARSAHRHQTDLTPVTDADRAVESDVRQTLELRPARRRLCEEFGGSTTFHRTAGIVDPTTAPKLVRAGVGQLDRAAEDGVLPVGGECAGAATAVVRHRGRGAFASVDGASTPLCRFPVAAARASLSFSSLSGWARLAHV